MEFFSRSRQSYTAVSRECPMTVLQVLYLNHPTRLAGFYPWTSMQCVTPEFVDVAKSHLKNLKHGFACGTEGQCTASMMCLSEFQIERKKWWTHQGLCMKGNFSIWKAPVDYLADWKTVWPKNPDFIFFCWWNHWVYFRQFLKNHRTSQIWSFVWAI